LTHSDKARDRSQRAVEMLGSAIDTKITELTESNRQLKRKIFDLYTIFEISRNFNAVLDYEVLVDTFLLTSLGQMGVSSAALYLAAPSDNQALTLVESKGVAHEEWATQTIRTDGEPAAFLLNETRPHATADLKQRFGDVPERLILDIFPGGLAIPLIFQSQLKGILFLGGKVSGIAFASDDMDFLSTLANQFVVAVENARLYQSERQALRDLKEAQRQLVLTERLAAIGELSAKIAHEVNNPLSIISNYLHLCERSLNDPGAAHRHLEVVRQELSRIARIVRQLLDFHRPPKSERVKVQTTEIMDSVLGLVEYQLQKKQISVSRQYDDSPPPVIGSPEQLKQVFLNLIINARDFMPEGGRLTVEIKKADTYVRIAVSDTGPGIAEEHLPRVFEPFFTTKTDGSGTGLGLSVCYGIISEHGGRIEASNLPEGGGCFAITLPAAETDGKDLA
jgi:signal transduction histidine kinase